MIIEAHLLSLLYQGLWVNIAKDQLFCLLGPNGAGKTTAINCLTGITPVTSGDGNVFLDIFINFGRSGRILYVFLAVC